MVQNFVTPPDALAALPPLEDFGLLQQKYQPLPLAARARAVLAQGDPALRTAEEILATLAENPRTRQVIENIRKNPVLTGKMRPSEGKNMLMDAGTDFIETTRHKLAVWRKTLERIASGEGIVSDKSKREYIPAHLPVAVAIAGLNATGSYLSIIQLALSELARMESKFAAKHQSDIAKIRRCATLLSDHEQAASIGVLTH